MSRCLAIVKLKVFQGLYKLYSLILEVEILNGRGRKRWPEICRIPRIWLYLKYLVWKPSLTPSRHVAFHLKNPSVAGILTRLSVGRSRNRGYIPGEGKGIFLKPSRPTLEPALHPVESVSRSVFGDKAAGAWSWPFSSPS